MSTPHIAHLAYGYDLGTNDDPGIQEKGEWGYADVSWMKRDSDGYLDEDLAEAVTRKLFESIPEDQRGEPYFEDKSIRAYYGVHVLSHGYSSDGNGACALAADVYTVDGGESLVLGPEDLAVSAEMDSRLDRALEALAGLTPSSPRGWTLLADR
jgi:hypothetical protein